MGLDTSLMRDLVEAGLFNEQALRMLIHYFRRADEDATKGYLE
jgi:phage tail tape-measure protein